MQSPQKQKRSLYNRTHLLNASGQECSSKYLDCRPLQIHVEIVVPENSKLAAWHRNHDRIPIRQEPRTACRHGHCTRSRTARQSLPGSPLPHSNTCIRSCEVWVGGHRRVCDFNKLHIRAMRKKRMRFDHRSELFHVDVTQRSNKQHCMWIAHGDMRYGTDQFRQGHICQIRSRQVLHKTTVVSSARVQLHGLSNEYSNNGRSSFNTRLQNLRGDRTNAHRNCKLGSASARLMQPHGHASQCISAQQTFRTVGIEHAHSRSAGIAVRRKHQYQSVCADATMPITHLNGQLRGIGWQWSREAVEKNVVVPATLHFDKRDQGRNPPKSAFIDCWADNWMRSKNERNSTGARSRSSSRLPS